MTVEYLSLHFSAPWREGLQRSGNGAIKTNLFNACAAVRGIPELGRRIYYDEMRGEVAITDPLPWDSRGNRQWTEHDDNILTTFLQRADLNVSTAIAAQAVETVAYEQRRHPIREYFDGLTWDGEPRIGAWLSSYLGVAYNAYSSTIGACWLKAAAARIRWPGCKVDNIVILNGPEGVRKSTAVKSLCPNVKWFSDSLPSIVDTNERDVATHLRGVWIIELAELAAVVGDRRAGSIEKVKAFATRETDRYRAAYARREIEVPRQCVFMGTSNETIFTSHTGNRRFWPVDVTMIDIDALMRDRDQLWAEAWHRIGDGEEWYITDPNVNDMAKEEQKAREEEDPWAALIAQWIDRLVVDGVDITSVLPPTILMDAIGVRASDLDRIKTLRVTKILRKAGYASKKRKVSGVSGWYWDLSQK